MLGFYCLFSVGLIVGVGGGVILFMFGLMFFVVIFIVIVVIVIIIVMVFNELIFFGDYKEFIE